MLAEILNEINILIDLFNHNKLFNTFINYSLINVVVVLFFTFVLLNFKGVQKIFKQHIYKSEPKTFREHWELYFSAPLMSANGICMWRIYASIPLAILSTIYYNDILMSSLCFYMYIFLFATDATDGEVARKLKNVTFIGKILDPLGDKVLVLPILIVVILYSNNYFFVLIGFCIIFFDILGQLIRGKSKNPAANWVGKAKTIVTMFTIFILSLNRYEVELNYIGSALLLITLGFTFWSFYGKLSVGMKSRSIDYLRRFLKGVLKKKTTA